MVAVDGGVPHYSLLCSISRAFRNVRSGTEAVKNAELACRPRNDTTVVDFSADIEMPVPAIDGQFSDETDSLSLISTEGSLEYAVCFPVSRKIVRSLSC